MSTALCSIGYIDAPNKGIEQMARGQVVVNISAHLA